MQNIISYLQAKKRQNKENLHAYLQVFQLLHPDTLPVPTLLATHRKTLPKL